METISGII